MTVTTSKLHETKIKTHKKCLLSMRNLDDIRNGIVSVRNFDDSHHLRNSLSMIKLNETAFELEHFTHVRVSQFKVDFFEDILVLEKLMAI